MTGSTGEPPPVCEALPGAPPPLAIGEVQMVPIDLTRVEAELTFDVPFERVAGRAVVEFRGGETRGLPIFDLRRTITRAVLDGEELPAEAIVPFDPPAEDAAMLAIDRPVEPCSEHRLELEYEFGVESVAHVFFYLNGITWATHLNDYEPGRLAEWWIPSNLIHDVHELQVDLVIVGAAAAQEVFANAEVAVVEPNRWRVTYPEATAMTPLIETCPQSMVERASATFDAGVPVEVDVWNCGVWQGTQPDLADYLAAAEPALKFAADEFGPYPHGERFALVAVTHGIDSMEYPGGTASFVIDVDHEVFHNWIGRGMRPLTQRDAWFDEAWTEFAVEDLYMTAPIPADTPPRTLAGDNPWVRAFPIEAYGTGSAILAALAAEIGLDPLRAILRDMYDEYAGQAVTTEMIERYLHCRIDSGSVRTLFHRFVHGREGAPPEPPADYCD